MKRGVRVWQHRKLERLRCKATQSEPNRICLEGLYSREKKVVLLSRDESIQQKIEFVLKKKQAATLTIFSTELLLLIVQNVLINLNKF